MRIPFSATAAAFGLLCVIATSVWAEVQWIDLPVSTGGTVKALLGTPEGVSKGPGVVYSHGTFVRRMGYDAAKAEGYDVGDYVEALNKAGYIALAPIRHEGVMFDPDPREVRDESTSSIQAGIEQGIAALNAAVAYLKDHAKSTGKIAVVGFSEGGLVTIWSLLSGLDVEAAVLMSPATFKMARRLNMKNALQSDSYGNIRAPILVTLGEGDNTPILRVVKKRLIPTMKKAGVAVETRPDYPGDHSWFWSVRPEHFKDVRAFLDKKLR